MRPRRSTLNPIWSVPNPVERSSAARSMSIQDRVKNHAAPTPLSSGAPMSAVFPSDDSARLAPNSPPDVSSVESASVILDERTRLLDTRNLANAHASQRTRRRRHQQRQAAEHRESPCPNHPHFAHKPTSKPPYRTGGEIVLSTKRVGVGSGWRGACAVGTAATPNCYPVPLGRMVTASRSSTAAAEICARCA